MKEMLDIFLSKKDKSKGIVSHIKKEGLKHEYALHYYKSCGFKGDIKDNLLKVAEKINPNYILEKLTADELDVYVGLNTFGLKAEVTIAIDGKNMFDEIKKAQGANTKSLTSATVSIKTWKNILFDYYDFDKALGFPLPNPHFGQCEEGKIHPEIQNIHDVGKIKHDYLVKMSETNPPLANPFYVYKEFAENSSEFLIQNEKIKL